MSVFLLTPAFALSSSAASPDWDPYAPAPNPPVCSLDYILPGDIGPSIPDQATDGDFMQFAWRTFLALQAPEPGGQLSTDGDNTPQWSNWSSTSDLLNRREPGVSGSRYYPPICRFVPEYENYRVLQQVGKIDDSFLEAADGTLSADPVLDRNGNFLRFEIMLSPALYDEVIDEKLYDRRRLNARIENVNLVCGEADYTAGNPADSRIGAMVLKAAWMDASQFSQAEKAKYHTESLLVFSPSYANATGFPSCEVVDMALVGLHVARKTTQQPNWTWATWEHVDNAPDCTKQMPNGRGGPINSACPMSPSQDYNFFSQSCQDESVEGPCQSCNVAPANNTTKRADCVNPFSLGTCSDDPSIQCTTNKECRSASAGTCVDEGWCLDLPPKEISGKSRLCRQVPVESGVCSGNPGILCASDSECSAQGAGTCESNYPMANAWNAACWQAIDAAGNGRSVWANYGLLGIQWVAQKFSGCENVQDVVFPPGQNIQYSIIEQLVHLAGDGTKPDADRPVLANTAMESYERSNCTGCHAKSGLQGICSTDANQTCTIDFECPDEGLCNQVATDFMYWLKLEVGDPPAILSKGKWFKFTKSTYRSRSRNRLRMKYANRVTYVPEEFGSNDPRCLTDAEGTVKARIRFFNNDYRVDSFDLDLPCENWQKVERGGYTYRSKTGACRRVDVRMGKRVSASCSDVLTLQHFVPAGASLSSVLTLNRVRYCAEFDDFTEKHAGRRDRFKSRTGSLGEQCPVPVRLLRTGLQDLEDSESPRP